MKRLFAALAIVLAVACRDQTATQYVGTVMNEASPEAEGTLRLTLFSHTDTSFTGIMELGPPATGTGPAYVWHEGSALKIVTVAATGEDTILWTSKLTDEGLGGRYEVTGGKRAGQGGTWRAHLTRGPPATPATLRQPTGVVLPPASALWPLLLVLLVGTWLARWIRRAPQPTVGGATAAPDGGGASRQFRPGPSGVAGWLAFFVFTQALGIVITLARLDAVWSEYAGIGMGAVLTGLQSLVVLEVALQLLSPVIALAGIVLVVRRSRYAPRYWFGYLAASVIYLSADLLVAGYMESQMRRLLGAAYANAMATDKTTEMMIRQLIASFIWALYWARSERVRATFGARGLDRRACSMPVAATPVESPVASPSPWRRRARIALRTAGALAAALVVLIGVTAWRTRVRPYSVPAGRDIRKTVAGRWAWTTDKKRCANAHVIAFSDDRKVMTIVQPPGDIGAPETTTTYDIQLVTQSTIRGAIRGETRLAADGKPAVWDLVLVGPDEYRWRRTDWATPWGYTASIVRCPTNNMADSPTR